MSATADSTLADLQRSNADLRRELADLRGTLDERTHERDEALQRETAAAEVLAVINSSPGDLAPVFDAMLDKALQLCGAAFGILHTIDGERSHIAAHRGVSPTFAEFLTGTPHEFSKTGPGLIGQLLRGERVIHHDAAESEGYRSGRPIARALVELEGGRSVLAVPLSKDNALLGMVMIYRREVRPFSDKQIALLQNFAAQAVIAMENARLLTETREALEQQTATAEVLQVINSSPGDLAPVFDAMVERAVQLCEADEAAVRTFDGEWLHLVAAYGEPGVFDRLQQLGPSRPDGLYGSLAHGERVTHISDVRETEAFRHNERARERLELRNIRSWLAVALQKDGALLGVINVHRHAVRPFTDKQVALLQNFAAQAVIAMENARLITETREALEQQTATAEVLGVINSSPGDIAPVFDAMLEKAMRLCDVAFGMMSTYDGEQFYTEAMRGVPEKYAQGHTLNQPHPGPETGLGRIERGEDIVHILDLADTDAYRAADPRRRDVVDLGGARTYVAVALRKDGKLLGSLAAYRQEVRAFSNRQIALLRNFAAQAVIAMENARLITETREALDHQTATAEVLQVINSSPGDLAPVFDAMVEKALRLCEAAFGQLHTFDGEHWHTAAMRGLPDAYREYRVRTPPVYGPGTGPALIMGGEDIVHIADIADSEPYRAGEPARRALVDLGGARSYIAVALRKDRKLLGVITIFRQEVRPFTDKHIALLQNFAAQAVIAIENARLINETREALEQQTATSEVLGVINSSPGDLKPVFDAMVERALRLCEADAATVRTFDGELLHLAAAHAEPRMMEQLPQLGPSHLNWLYEPLSRGERVIHIPDVRETEAYREMPGARERLDLRGIRSWLAVALCKDGALLGVLNVNRRDVRPFTDKQIALLENFAAQAVVAIENARLLGELRQRTEEVGELNRGLEARVADQLAELERTGKLRRFLAPQLADLIIAQGDESILESHRREIVVVFCDIRGFTSFAERAEPEEVMALLRDYHTALGPIVARFEGTLDHYSGDGVMVFFNDPLPTPEPAKQAIEMAVAMREAAQQVLKTWRRHGHDLGFGVGISQGYATLGQIGFAERMDYTAIGTVTNLAARLCSEAKDGQILISRRVAIAVEEDAKLEEIGEVSLKGLSQAVAVYNVVQ